MRCDAIIDGSNVVTATFDFEQYLGQHNQGNHTALFGDVNAHLAGKLVPIPIVGSGPCKLNGVTTGQAGGCFKGCGSIFHVISAHGGSQKNITGYLRATSSRTRSTVGECTAAQHGGGQCGLIRPDHAVRPTDVRLTN